MVVVPTCDGNEGELWQNLIGTNKVSLTVTQVSRGSMPCFKRMHTHILHRGMTAVVLPTLAWLACVSVTTLYAICKSSNSSTLMYIVIYNNEMSAYVKCLI